MSDIGQESTLLGYSAFALGMALSAPQEPLPARGLSASQSGGHDL
jgi:hypothetical protein